MDGAGEAVLAAAAFSQYKNRAEGEAEILRAMASASFMEGLSATIEAKLYLSTPFLVRAVQAPLELCGLEHALERILRPASWRGLEM